MHTTILEVTARIIERSKTSRQTYLDDMKRAEQAGVSRASLSCGNLAHGFAACQPQDKHSLKLMNAVNLGVVTAYNDMLSAHQPYATYPDLIKQAARSMGSVAQVAGGVPAMCDGVTQGQSGMELSLFSRDVIALSSAVALSHNMFDAAMYLGVCDKIVPGLLMSALRFGHLPTIFVPAGPMTSGLPNKEKARIRQLYAEGKVDREALLQCESDSYHSAGTCTFYGTANTNQLVVELMGLHLPGSSFINPGTSLREVLTEEATYQLIRLTKANGQFTPLYKIINEKSIVNGLVALLATGGSTNHTMHFIAIARAAGIIINWDDFDDLSACVPLLARIYPNGEADINHFQAAGGTAFLVRELLAAGLLHEDVDTVAGFGLERYKQEPCLDDGCLSWKQGVENSLDRSILTPVAEPFSRDGGLRLLQGNLGRGVIKVSAVKAEHQVVEAPAVVFEDQNELAKAYERGELNKDFIAVVRYQGPKACGMPELHKLTPYLGSLQDQGFQVGLVTDGRMSGASGKVPAAIHVWPEAVEGGVLAFVETGDTIHLNAKTGSLSLLVDEDVLAKRRSTQPVPIAIVHQGMGREMFSNMRHLVGPAETGASFIFNELES